MLRQNTQSVVQLLPLAQLKPLTDSDWLKVKKPKFVYGVKVRWLPLDDCFDWGVVAGVFYSYSRHLKSWSWCYLIVLDSSSFSYSWCKFDVAWEEDLEGVELAKLSPGAI